MNEGQEKFHDYILERTHEHKKEDQKDILAKSFSELSNTETKPQKDFITKINKKILENIKPEYIEDVTAILNGFASNF